MAQSYREDCNDAKNARRGVKDQRPLKSKNQTSKSSKKYVLEYIWVFTKADHISGWAAIAQRKWSKFGSYRDEAEARKVIESQLRKHPGMYEFRVKLNGQVI